MGTEVITPERAKQLLAANADCQRKLSANRVNLYAADMTRGTWMYNGDAIRLDRNGRLIDGQHRLAAIVKSGTAQLMDVVTGLDPACFATIDRGQARTAAQSTGIKAGQLAAAKVLLIYEGTGRFVDAATSTSAYPTPDSAQADVFHSATAWCNAVVRAVEWLKAPFRTMHKGVSILPFAAAAAALVAKGEPVDAPFKFYRELANAYKDESTQLARAFMRLYDPGNDSDHRRGVAALALRAYNCWSAGTALRGKAVDGGFFDAYNITPGRIEAIREMR